MSAPAKQMSPANLLGGALGAVVGYYAGIMLVIPLVATAIVFFIIKKITASRLEPFKLAIAALLGHSIWMSLALFTGPGAILMILPDFLLIAIGLIWLFARPGRGVVWYFTIFEAVSAVINIVNILGQPFNTSPHKALVAHLCMRGFIITAFWIAVRKPKPIVPPPLPAT
jgi:hypothetical protein